MSKCTWGIILLRGEHMRKITRKVSEAFAEGYCLRMSNAETCGHALYLYGNNIAYIIKGTLYLTFASCPTPTTREHLNGLLEVISNKYKWKYCPRFCQTNHTQYFDHFESNFESTRVVCAKEILALDLKNGNLI